MIAYWPGVIEPGSITDRVGHLVDFTPTMLQLAKSNMPENLAGGSLLPTLQGETDERPWPLFWQFGSSKAIRDREWKLVKHGKSDWELYHLAEDPTELNDLAGKYPNRVAEMSEDWQTWWSDQGELNR